MEKINTSLLMMTIASAITPAVNTLATPPTGRVLVPRRSITASTASDKPVKSTPKYKRSKKRGW